MLGTSRSCESRPCKSVQRPRKFKPPCEHVKLLASAIVSRQTGTHGTRLGAFSFCWAPHATCWPQIQQLGLMWSSGSLHAEACRTLQISDGIIHTKISFEVVRLCAATNNGHSFESVRPFYLSKSAWKPPQARWCRVFVKQSAHGRCLSKSFLHEGDLL